ncbi:MAG: hypothetical protein V1903_03965 [Bacteroidota bacterium]
MNVKYKTKNNITDDIPVFLPKKNHRNANMSSVRNLRLMASRVCMVWLPNSLSRPLKNIMSAKKVMRVNPAEDRMISLYSNPDSIPEIIMYPTTRTVISSIASRKIVLARGFKRNIIF